MNASSNSLFSLDAENAYIFEDVFKQSCTTFGNLLSSNISFVSYSIVKNFTLSRITQYRITINRIRSRNSTHGLVCNFTRQS